ncbi:MAG: hypothetical protein J0I20_33905 [Chloroflexi bacterium]|nr:hypothetical protein [Chloroflexota bacterium]OJW05609.1 MAG: hypothetical protein BGO39_03050 [Chloroflexi bacterium 54-19]
MKTTSLRFNIRIGKDRYGLDYDTNYGMNKRTGWSFTWNGSYFTELEKSLIKAVWVGFKKSRAAKKDMEKYESK